MPPATWEGMHGGLELVEWDSLHCSVHQCPPPSFCKSPPSIQFHPGPHCCSDVPAAACHGQVAEVSPQGVSGVTCPLLSHILQGLSFFTASFSLSPVKNHCAEPASTLRTRITLEGQAWPAGPGRGQLGTLRALWAQPPRPLSTASVV